MCDTLQGRSSSSCPLQEFGSKFPPHWLSSWHLIIDVDSIPGHALTRLQIKVSTHPTEADGTACQAATRRRRLTVFNTKKDYFTFSINVTGKSVVPVDILLYLIGSASIASEVVGSFSLTRSELTGPGHFTIASAGTVLSSVCRCPTSRGSIHDVSNSAGFCGLRYS